MSENNSNDWPSKFPNIGAAEDEDNAANNYESDEAANMAIHVDPQSDDTDAQLMFDTGFVGSDSDYHAVQNTDISQAQDAESETSMDEDSGAVKVRMELYDWMQCVVSAVICGIFIFVFIGRTI